MDENVAFLSFLEISKNEEIYLLKNYCGVFHVGETSKNFAFQEPLALFEHQNVQGQQVHQYM